MIWQRIKSGDLEALGVLYDEYVDTLIKYGKHLCSDEDYVKDCVHDLFVDLYKYRKNLSSTTSVEYYLLRSLKNKIIKKQKTRMIMQPFDKQIKLYHPDVISASEEENIIHGEACSERSLRLASAMNLLTRQQRRGINLRFVEDRSYQEIAHVLNVSIQTARTVIYRGIKLLRQNMLFVLATTMLCCLI